MKQFTSIAEMTTAYAEKYNANYTDEAKHFTADDVAAVVVERRNALTMKIRFGIALPASARVAVIDGYGYVVAAQ